MNRRDFIYNGTGLTAGSLLSGSIPGFLRFDTPGNPPGYSHRLPQTDHHYKRTCGYVEEVPVPEYKWAPESAYEDFQDMKFGIRLHWGLYAINRLSGESWPFIKMTPAEKQTYQELYKSWYPPPALMRKSGLIFLKTAGPVCFPLQQNIMMGFPCLIPGPG